MSLKQASLSLIVAATTKNGIGKNGGLPWPMLKKEMAYFARVTKRVPMPKDTGSLQSDLQKHSMLEGVRQNAVIMGRKTWESIPPKFRPLKGRTNIVISSQARDSLGYLPDDVIVAPSITTSLEALSQAVTDQKALPVGRIFVIGGSSIYKTALELPQVNSILLTRIQNDFDCDTCFPADLTSDENVSSGWARQSQLGLSGFVGEEVPSGLESESGHDGEVHYEFQLFQRR
ncbi:hypothetical protein K431DRAFT_286759 [Polychaeton citri CBS 116435]|uniref:Dihydrofolate reductase n=1 Tax=Polychaeton citri CBS 116435 TaxID=1314669 RepID=A0A9P4Q7K7_9PEZI|nr:hypothetical protein K431DRAFT_286759 [Polychaeton citri CBS 116435]